MKITARSRFHYAKRLDQNGRSTNEFIAISSACVIIISVLSEFFYVSENLKPILFFINFITGLLIIITSLMHHAASSGAPAEQSHRSGLEINEIIREILSCDQVSSEEINNFSKKYSDVLQKYSINHDKIDYEITMIYDTEERKKFNIIQALFIHIKHFSITNYIKILMIIVFAATICMLYIILVMPYFL